MKNALYVILVALLIVGVYLFFSQKKDEQAQTKQAQPQTEPIQPIPISTKGGGMGNGVGTGNGTGTQQGTPVINNVIADAFNLSDEEKEAYKNKTFLGKLFTFTPLGYTIFSLSK